MISNFPSVMLIVRDIAQSLHFYRDFLGLSLYAQDEWDGHRIAYLKMDAFKLVLFQQPEEDQPSPADNGHLLRGDGVLLSFSVNSIMNLATTLKGAGLTILRDLKDAPWGERTLMVADPDGYAVLLAETPMIQA